jgi:hypothetical protein
MGAAVTTEYPEWVGPICILMTFETLRSRHHEIGSGKSAYGQWSGLLPLEEQSRRNQDQQVLTAGQ